MKWIVFINESHGTNKTHMEIQSRWQNGGLDFRYEYQIIKNKNTIPKQKQKQKYKQNTIKSIKQEKWNNGL